MLPQRASFIAQAGFHGAAVDSELFKTGCVSQLDSTAIERGMNETALVG